MHTAPQRIRHCLLTSLVSVLASYGTLTVSCEIECLARGRQEVLVRSAVLEAASAKTATSDCHHPTDRASDPRRTNEPTDNTPPSGHPCQECDSSSDKILVHQFQAPGQCIASGFADISLDADPSTNFQNEIQTEASPPLYSGLIPLRI
jgi:hypothetical protein